MIYPTTNTTHTNIGNNFEKEKEKKWWNLTQKHKISQNWANFSPLEALFSLSISVLLSLLLHSCQIPCYKHIWSKEYNEAPLHFPQATEKASN